MIAPVPKPYARPKISSAMSTIVMRPPLKWAGGKRWLVPALNPLWAQDRNRRFVEPFCGGLAVALGLRPKRALLNDVNPHLINFYRWVQKGLVLTIRMRNDRDAFDRHRKRFNDLAKNGGIETQEAAELFYYLNRTGFNGLFRTSRKGGYNVPFGQHSTITYRKDLRSYQPAMKDWKFTSGDFEEVELKKGDFVYAD